MNNAQKEILASLGHLPRLGCTIITKLDNGKIQQKTFDDELLLAEHLVKTYYSDLKNRGVL